MLYTIALQLDRHAQMANIIQLSMLHMSLLEKLYSAFSKEHYSMLFFDNGNLVN